MQIETASLEGAGKKFAHSYPPEELALADDRVRLIGPVEISGRVKADGDKLAVVGQVETRIQVECDRCLRPIDVPVKAEFDLEYVTTKTYESLQAAELSEEDLELSVYDGEVIDIDELAREQLLLATPSQLLCDSECKGFCPVCGADRNFQKCDCHDTEIDPRWAELKRLSDSK